MIFTRVILILAVLLIGMQLTGQSEPSTYTSTIPTPVLPYHKALETSLLNGQVDTAWVIYRSMVADIDTTGDVHAQAWVWYHYGDVLSYSERYEESNVAYAKAIQLTLNMVAPNAVILIRGNNNLYYNNDELGNRDLAFDYILKAYDYLAYAPPGESRSNIIFNLARALKRQGEIGMAGRYMEQVLEMDEEGNDSLAVGYDYQFLAEVYRLQKNIPATIHAYRKAIAITPPQHADRLSMYHNGIADAHGYAASLDSARYYNEVAVDIARTAGLKNILAFVLREKGEICTLQGDRICAEVAFNEAQLLAQSLGMRDLSAESKMNWAENLSGQPKKKLLLEVLQEARQNEWPSIEMSAYNALLADPLILNSDEKIDYFQRYNQHLKDRISDDAGKETKRLEARMALIQSEQQINNLQREAVIAKKEARTNRIIRFVLLALVLLSIAGMILIYQTLKQKRKLTEANYRNQITAKVNEVQALQSRLTVVLDEKKEVLSLPDHEDLNNIIDTPLTEKEYEILVDVSKGMTNKEIGEKQFISANTVKFHLKNVFAKLDVANRKEAINRVLKEY